MPGIVLLLSYLAFVSLGLPDTVLGVAWPSLQARFAITPSALGALLASGVGGYFLSGLFAGEAVVRIGVGGVLTLSSGLVTLALAGYALAPSWALFFPLGGVLGLGSGAIDAALNGYAARNFSVRHVNWLHGCWGIGATIGPASMTFVIARGHGYRAGYALLGAVLATMALLFWFTRRRWNAPPQAPEVSEAASRAQGDVDDTNASAPGAKPQSLWVALRDRRVLLQVLVFLLYTSVESTVGQWCFSWLRDRRGLSIEAAGSWTSAYWASLTLGRLVLGGIVGRVGPDRLLRSATLGAVIGVTLFASAASWLGYLGLILLGSSLAPMFPTLMARTPARVGDGLAHHAVGLQVSAATLGSALGPSAAGFFVANQGLAAVGGVIVAVAAALLVSHELLLAVTPPWRSKPSREASS
ncbi:MAG TPA: MFS transporter [Polyangiaceae bacterium]|nr:MFS transporter [Polyangiaceae bacterium]